MDTEQAKPESGIEIDTSSWPIVLVSTPAKVTDEELEQFLQKFSEEVRRKEKRYALVLDLRETEKLSPKQRRALTSTMNQDRKFNERYCACTAMVFDSVVLRGVLTAVLWLFSPPYPTKMFKQRRDAVAWAKTQL